MDVFQEQNKQINKQTNNNNPQKNVSISILHNGKQDSSMSVLSLYTPKSRFNFNYKALILPCFELQNTVGKRGVRFSDMFLLWVYTVVPSSLSIPSLEWIPALQSACLVSDQRLSPFVYITPQLLYSQTRVQPTLAERDTQRPMSTALWGLRTLESQLN